MFLSPRCLRRCILGLLVHGTTVSLLGAATSSSPITPTLVRPSPQAASSAEPTALTIPPQDQGLPYTQSGRSSALAALQGLNAVWVGSRYGLVQSVRFRLSQVQPLGGEVRQQDGKIWVPRESAWLLTQEKIQVPPIPVGMESLSPRWVYSPDDCPPASISRSNVSSIRKDGIEWVDLGEVARLSGCTLSIHPRGLVVIGKRAVDFNRWSPVTLEAVITLFDTPEKFADPAIATQYVPLLKAQGAWETHAKADPKILKRYEGPETEWPTADPSQYDLTGFQSSLLGSPVPAPGQYPRLLFNESDLPMLRQRLQQNQMAQMSLIEVEELLKQSWWDASTSDGKSFAKLSSGQFSEKDFLGADGKPRWGAFADQKPGIFNTHVNYITNCLTTMALYCLLQKDDVHGRQAAAAMYHYLKVIAEPKVKEAIPRSDSEVGWSTEAAHNGQTAWRGMAGNLSHCDVAFMLDFGGKWMTAEEKSFVQNLLAQAIYGRRDTHQSGPVSWRENNHATWHGTNFLCAMAIEGLPGCDPELFPEAVRHIRAFLDYGIDPQGQIFESNGKSGGGLNFHVLNMIALARRGQNLWGHPHWRKLLEAQAQNTSPDGTVTVSGGTFSGSRLCFQTIHYLKAFYPQNPSADYLLTVNFPELNPAQVNLDEYRAQVRAGKIRALRLPGPTYSGWTRTILYDTDWKPTNRRQANFPLAFETSTHGILSAFSSNDSTAAWLNLQVRPNQYYGAGHHHNDSGMIHFSSQGVNWIVESPYFSANYDGNYHNLVRVDGISNYHGGWAAPGRYLGAALGDSSATAACDLAYSYSWRWLSQPPAGSWENANPSAEVLVPWELDGHPNAVKYYRGTQHWKMRPWWPSYNFSNWYPVLRTPCNPMRTVFRTAGLVRGPHPYAWVVDDLCKDDQEHLYEWNVMLNRGVWQADVPGLPPGCLALGYEAPKDPRAKITSATTKPLLKPASGDPLLLIFSLPHSSSASSQPIAETKADGPREKDQPTYYDWVKIALKQKEAHFRVLLVPYRFGDPLPSLTQPDGARPATLAWTDQKDELRFTEGSDARTRITVSRGGKIVAEALP